MMRPHGYAVLAALALAACNGVSLEPVELEKKVPDPGGCPSGWRFSVDILFVIDNSSSMGHAQAKLAASFDAFIDVLESWPIEVDYRIGVTTTDNGNPWCPGSTPEAGNLVLESCKNRLSEFVVGDAIDVRDLACTDLCTLDDQQLEILPTRTDFDFNPAPRPWLESIGGQRNLPEGTSMADALACFVPQGVSGCGFGSPLESMYLALARARASSETSYGFMRAEAALLIVFVTDGVDCSYDKDWTDIFAADGNKLYWSDPGAMSPSAALCWNAGVECVGDPGGYDSCDPVDKTIDGELAAAEGEAVLHPLRRYVDQVQHIEGLKRQINPTQEVTVALIGGVMDDGSIVYADAEDPLLQDSWGIGPGCTGVDGSRATPPVRLREFTDAFAPANLHSICSTDFAPALEAIVKRVLPKAQPLCFTRCVADLDPSTEILEPECAVEQKLPNGERVAIPECLRDADGYVIDPDTERYAMPSETADVCYAALVDPGGLTSDPHDDLSLECSSRNYQLEFVLARRPGAPAGSGALAVSCLLADFPEVDCPGLGRP
jgi:hypothetical protein